MNIREILEAPAQSIQDAHDRAVAQIAKLQQQLTEATKQIAELQAKLQAAVADAAALKQKCETMADHPDVRQAALDKAKANLKAAQDRLDTLHKTTKPKE